MKRLKICVVGLGYVGLPLAVEFGKEYETIGFDINPDRIYELNNFRDKTNELSQEEIKSATKLIFTYNKCNIKNCNVYIITVPTPVDDYNVPDLSPLISASELVGKHMTYGSVVIYESTTYPGCTEEVCVPILEKESGMKRNVGFFYGYSPERINPGDKVHKVTNIKKVTSGSTPETADFVDNLYNSILKSGTHKASSVKVAEASKIIENSQRDVNIAFMNEISMIFSSMGIDIYEVLEAAKTKWNFLPFKPGLVGGHCIGVDPYYLIHKAKSVGISAELLSSARKINNNMSSFIIQKFISLLIQNATKPLKDIKILQLGISFKENCPDIRNSKSIEILLTLSKLGLNVTVFDPVADINKFFKEYGIKLEKEFPGYDFDAIILTVAHNEFDAIEFDKFKNAILFDIKNKIPKTENLFRL